MPGQLCLVMVATNLGPARFLRMGLYTVSAKVDFVLSNYIAVTFHTRFMHRELDAESYRAGKGYLLSATRA